MIPSDMMREIQYFSPHTHTTPFLFPQTLTLTPNLLLPSSSSSSSDADDRKHRRMISNRESARRSRMRKQRHLDELFSQLLRLRNDNHSLLDKLNHVSQSHDRVLQENAKLREEISDLRRLVADLQIGTLLTDNNVFADLDHNSILGI